MPVTTCMLCHQPLVMNAEDLKDRKIPTVGADCRAWLAEGMGLDAEGLAFNLEQMIMIACLQDAVEAGHIGQNARDTADEAIFAAITDIYNRYSSKHRARLNQVQAQLLEAKQSITGEYPMLP